MEALEVFHFENEETSFEAYGKANGFRYWLAQEMMKFLNYDNWQSLKKAINKAIAACAQLNIPIEDNFIKTTTVVDGKPVDDYKLSRFACYFTTMYCDPKKPQVQKAFAYFAAIADQFQKQLEDAENCERLVMREEITTHEKTLAGVANAAGVAQYQLFQNAGYRGLYNMNLSKLKTYKGLEDTKRCLLDFMGREELAANLFRITQTEAKIRNENIHGQRASEAAAESVGREVRSSMLRISGNAPEDLPLSGDIRDTRKSLKGAHKTFKKMDDSKTNKALQGKPTTTEQQDGSDNPPETNSTS